MAEEWTEMDNFGDGKVEEVEKASGTAEESLIDDDNAQSEELLDNDRRINDESVIIQPGDNPDYMQNRETWGRGEQFKDLGRDLEKRIEVLENFGIHLRYEDGPATNTIIDNITLRHGKNDNFLGLDFRGNIVTKIGANKIMVYAKENKTVTEFKKLVELARKEHEKNFRIG